MSLHDDPDHNNVDIQAALKAHGMPADTPSQLADAFRLGWAAAWQEKSMPDEIELYRIIKRSGQRSFAGIAKAIARACGSEIKPNN